MRPLTILATAQAALLMFGAAVAPSYAASPPDDGVTIVPSVTAPAPSSSATTETLTSDDGDSVTAPAGFMIMVSRDPKTGAYSYGVVPGR